MQRQKKFVGMLEVESKTGSFALYVTAQQGHMAGTDIQEDTKKELNR